MTTHRNRAFAELAIRSAIASLCLLALLPGAARAAGVDQACGGPTHVRCDAGLWCDQQPGTCGNPNAPGVCLKAEVLCTAMFVPVCGCDKKDYGNICERWGKTSIDYAGACRR